MREYVIHPMVVGINETDQGVMTYLKGYGKRIYLPIYVFYLEGGPEKILVDTGLEQFMVPAGVEEQCGFKVQEFEDALDGFGLKPEDIDIAEHPRLGDRMGFSSKHGNTVTVALDSGRALRLSIKLPQSTIDALYTRNGGERVGDF